MQNARILAHGVSSAGQNVSYDATSDKNGDYSIQVADGNYEVSGIVYPTYPDRTGQERTWELPLHPIDNDTTPVTVTGGSSETKNFKWKLSGPKPWVSSSGQSENEIDYYGASIRVEPSNLTFTPPWPEDYVAHFTLEPTGPMIDGSQGQVLRFERTLAELNREDGVLDDTHYLYDIPIGTYRLTALLKLPDGSTTVGWLPLSGSQGGPFYETFDVRFSPSSLEITSADGPDTLNVYVDTD